jgi:hypothetical protein
VTARDASGRFAVVRPLPSATWADPDGLTDEQRIWVQSTIEHIVAGLEPLPVLEPDTGLCELRIAVPFENTTLEYICTRPSGHRGEPCAPLNAAGENVLEALERAVTRDSTEQGDE